MFLITIVIIVLTITQIHSDVINRNRKKIENDYFMHESALHQSNRHRRAFTNDHDSLLNDHTHLENVQLSEYWKRKAQSGLREQLNKRINTNKAKNVILFLGDGMSIPTLTAARIYNGQLHGLNGQQSELYFDKFPYTGFSKTYCVDKHVADSACSATAYLCGIKANQGTIGVNAQVRLGDCEGMTNKNNHVSSIAKWAQDVGKSTGIVTTTRVTHASPAGTYAHTAHRDWETDTDISNSNNNPDVCIDIAKQLVLGPTGKHFEVILGGGRKNFYPRNETDAEGNFGSRTKDNLIKEWLNEKIESGINARYVTNRTSLMSLKDNPVDSVLGLFAHDHLLYHLDAKELEDQPTLADMTEAAISILQQNPKGYFLFVEGGRIDHAHHSTLAQKALDETVEFAKAIETAARHVDLEDTLIVITSDHAHTMSISGYSDTGSNILAMAGEDTDHLPYTTLNYANGPGFRRSINGMRHNLSTDNTLDKDFQFSSLVPLKSETHGGDDVAIFANGPWSHLFTGVIEQNMIPHLIGFATCLGDGLTICDLFKHF